MNKLHSSNIQKTSTSANGLIFNFAFILALFISTFAVNTSSVQAQTLDTPIDATSTPAVIWPDIKAQSAFVYNPLNNTTLYQKNADVPRPTASLLKIMTAGVANSILNMAPHLAQKPITILKTKDENTADKALKAGSKWLPSELIQYMLIGSSNKAAESLASGLIPRSSFISLMNFQARRMGLTNTRFTGPSGLDNEGTSTARELSHMFWNVVAENPGLLDVTRQESRAFETEVGTGKVSFIVNNTNALLKDLPIVFGKTGFTDSAGGNLAIITQNNERATPYVIVALGSTVIDRYSDVAALASSTLKIEGLRNSFSNASTSTSTIAQLK